MLLSATSRFRVTQINTEESMLAFIGQIIDGKVTPGVKAVSLVSLPLHPDLALQWNGVVRDAGQVLCRLPDWSEIKHKNRKRINGWL